MLNSRQTLARLRERYGEKKSLAAWRLARIGNSNVTSQSNHRKAARTSLVDLCTMRSSENPFQRRCEQYGNHIACSIERHGDQSQHNKSGKHVTALPRHELRNKR